MLTSLSPNRLRIATAIDKLCRLFIKNLFFTLIVKSPTSICDITPTLAKPQRDRISEDNRDASGLS
jgi:hypothetical protein